MTWGLALPRCPNPSWRGRFSNQSECWSLWPMWRRIWNEKTCLRRESRKRRRQVQLTTCQREHLARLLYFKAWKWWRLVGIIRGR